MQHQILICIIQNLKGLEEIVQSWFKTSRATGISVDGVLLREKLLKMANILGIENFGASNGWIDQFRKRYSIICKTVCGELNAVGYKTRRVDQWKITEDMNPVTFSTWMKLD
ncbi:hypothetical protein AVEN_225950-1 [Araneus ventricosus]|uniref:HTH CENPB-type domain-containing protein n=1 Tax=Araneus ventricosus TaxID=182803 RepID=A0A4Y2GPQ5_ARAVE|nr:hypothetical protein AVEN_225950-1 [Araneus ventricosus]